MLSDTYRLSEEESFYSIDDLMDDKELLANLGTNDTSSRSTMTLNRKGNGLAAVPAVPTAPTAPAAASANPSSFKGIYAAPERQAFLPRDGISRQSLISLSRQQSLDDINAVLQSIADPDPGACLNTPHISNEDERIQDLTKYLKRTTSNSPYINLNAFEFPVSSGPAALKEPKAESRLERIKEEAVNSPISLDEPSPLRSHSAGLYYPAAEERPCSSISVPPPGVASRPKRKATKRRKYEDDDEDFVEDDGDDYTEERDVKDADILNLPPPRKYVKKDINTTMDEDYRKRRDRNNIAVRRARAKKKQREDQMEATIAELSEQNERVQLELDNALNQISTQKQIIAELQNKLQHQ